MPYIPLSQSSKTPTGYVSLSQQKAISPPSRSGIPAALLAPYVAPLHQAAALVGDAKNIAKDTYQGALDIGERQLTGKQSLPESIVQLLGLGAKTAGNVVFGEPLRIASRFLPEAVKAPVKNAVSSVAKKAASIPIVKKGIDTAQKYAAENPGLAADLGAAGDIATVGLGATAAHEAAPAAERALKAGSESVSNLAERTAGPVSEHFAAKTAASEAEKTLEITRPVLTTAEKETALAANRGNTGGIFAKDAIVPSARDVERADVAHPFIAGTQDTNDAIAKVNEAIAAKSEVIKTGLKASGDPIFNKAQLRSYIAKFQQSPERQIILAGDDAAKKAYNGVLDTFMHVVDKYPKTVSGLLDARKEFDQIAEQGMKGVFGDGTVSARKQAILDIRRQANQYIEDQIPTGDAMKAVLHQQNLLYEARDNMAAKGAKNIGTSKAAQFLKAHPTATKIGASVVKGGIAVEAGKSLLGF